MRVFQSSMKHDIRSVLAISLGGLGDFLTRWPLWQSLRRSFPAARLSYLGYSSHAALICSAGLCDEAVDFEKGGWAAPSWAGFRFGLVVSVLGKRGRAWLHGLDSKIMEIEPFPEEGSVIHAGDHILSQIRALGLREPGPSRLVLPEEIRDAARRLAAEHGLEGKEVVAVHPGSGADSKNWPRERFIELAARLTAAGMVVIVLSGEAEAAKTAPGGDAEWKGDVIMLPPLGLPLLAALLGICRGYVGNDSGVSHLAAFTGTAATVIFGPTDPRMWAPRGRAVTVVRHAVSCSPCDRERRIRCPHRTCLDSITVDEVLAVMGFAPGANG